MGPWMVTMCLLTACGGGVSAPSAERVPLGREFTLAVGQSAVVGDTGLRLSLEGVSQDSRCPSDVQCVWEGDATVALAVAAAPGPRAEYELHTSGRYAREVEHGPYTVTLVRLAPVPKSGAVLEPSAYRATLLVVR
jgi:hypothetical protein